MNRIAVFALILCGLFSMRVSHATEFQYPPYSKERANPAVLHPRSSENIQIWVMRSGWGAAKAEDISIVLHAVAAELLAHFPGRRLDPILVSPGANGPVVLYQRGLANAYQVQLAARDERWAEYIYEFSHELFHILANYQYHAPPRISHNQWFEETLCESASLYALKKFSLRWYRSPPRPEWASYAPVLSRFAARAMNEPHRHLPADVSFAQWFRHNAAALSGSPYLREKNELVAQLFLPLLERHSDWQSISYMNWETAGEESGFRHYLAAWYRNTPPVHRDIVRDALKIFELDEPGVDTFLVATQPATTASMEDGIPAVGVAGRAGH